MNRSKHPDRPPFKRKNTNTDTTKNYRQWRVEASWNDHPDHPRAFVTQDRPQADRVARAWADRGAYVIVEHHKGDLRWRTLYELDGPALAEERRATLGRLMTRPPVPRNATGRATAHHTTGATR